MLHRNLIGEKVTVSGWGQTEYKGHNSNVLQYVDIEVLKDSTCRDIMTRKSVSIPYDVKYLMCAGDPKDWDKDACRGDSGGNKLKVPFGMPFILTLVLRIDNHAMYFVLGPVIYRDEGTDINYVVGVVSFGFGCATPDTPGYYSNVHPQMGWIKKVIKDSKTNKCPNADLRMPELGQDSAACAMNYIYTHPSSSDNKMVLLILLYFLI